MKYHFLFFALVSCTIFGQNKGLVHYGQIESVSLKSPVGPDYNGYLVFNNNESYYVSRKDSLDMDTEFKTIYYTEDGMSGLSLGNNLTFRFGNQVYNNRLKDSLYWNQWVDFYVAEKTPKIEWKLEKETKKIADFTAHKATGKFRGRTYTAWYVLEIPLPFGPWKLQGLPGLILEAHDEDKEMFIYFKGLEYPTDNKASITQIKRPVDHPKNWSTLQDFKDRLDDIYEKSKNTSIIIAQKQGSNVHEQKIKSETFLESF
ncbi:GLPGLI family protein [Xanthomarina sp. F1114]|uniref:GLPGLI family protein n=1 Tax=Xanthomarina sp. F1114 TaxID=2996019 RepID=UPI00225E360E|nr:GLPGLI family protein [Xanthomarina sp. F1114]MCX7546841.1 GLPGLI family protein [Xanthomarina sp. F1114]